MGFCIGNFDSSILPESSTVTGNLGLCMGNIKKDKLPQSIADKLSADIPKYGVQFDGVKSAGVRLEDAVGLNWARSSNTITGIDDFRNIAPFKTREVIRRYNTASGKRETLAYEGDANFEALKSSKTGDRMIEFTKSYYSRTSETTFLVSPAAQEGFDINPMFYHGGKEWNHCAISKYNIGMGYVSQPGYRPLVNSNMNTFRTNLRNKGLNILDYPSYCGAAILMLVKYANMDLQSVVGAGISSSSSVVPAGGADAVKGVDGSATYVSNAKEAVLTMGIENLYGNIFKFMDGIYKNGANIYMKDVLDMINDPTIAQLSSYNVVDTHIPTDSGDIKNIAFDEKYKYLLYPTTTGTPSPTGDYLYTAAGFDCFCVGGASSNGTFDGLFTAYCLSSVGTSASSYGCLGVEFYD